ncbi:hypothetical protein [Streptococcus gordonii]|uniref:hypothetical protein n=1 Tax=Streptococcus gordonii TaxID=1302 RepID=UPI0022840DF6|nr:hypothetical protein [Streptococcus gordonii]MCY7137613.1 hypothetical protein [Streptococcus gordonii]
MSFKRVIFLILAVFAVYHGFVTPLPADSDVSYRMGALAANVLLPALLFYFAFKKEKPKKEKLQKEKDKE